MGGISRRLAGRLGRGGGRRRPVCLAVSLSLLLLGALLPVVAASAPAAAQTAASYPATLHRTEIIQGQIRQVLISGIPDGHRYWLRAETVTISGNPDATAQGGDFYMTVKRRASGSSRSTSLAIMNVTWNNVYEVVPARDGTLTFEWGAGRDGDTHDEVFGLKLCTTSNCAGGTVLGDWRMTIKPHGADTTLTGTGATISVSEGSTTMMEETRNRDHRDTWDTVTLTLDAAPSTDVVVVGRVAQTEPEGNDRLPRNIAEVIGTASKHEAFSRTGYREALIFRTTYSGGDLTLPIRVKAINNLADSPGGSISGTVNFKVFQYDSAYTDDDPNTAATEVTSIVVPDLPFTITDDDDPTTVELLAAATPDDTAVEGTTDTAEFRVQLGRALAADESLTVPLFYSGAASGDFSVALDGSPMGVTLASSGASVTFAGPSAAEATLVVTALADDDNISERLEVSTAESSDPRAQRHFTAALDGGACSGEGCPPRSDGTHPSSRYTVDLTDDDPGVVFTFTAGSGNLPESRRVPESGCGSSATYRYGLRLGSQPSSAVTVTVSSSDLPPNGTSTFTFEPGTWNQPQQVVFDCHVNNSTDEIDRVLAISHAFASSDSSYSGLDPQALTVTVTDDDPTTVTLSGGGADRDNRSQVMVEGASAADTLTVSLGRPLTVGEYVRVPLRLTADLNGSVVPNLQGGVRTGANLSYPPIHNDITMAASGTGVTLEHPDVRTDYSTGYRVVAFRGAGAQTAVIRMQARSGFDDGEVADESFSVRLLGDLTVAEGVTARFLPVDNNLGGGVRAWQTGAARWFGIADDDSAVVPADWAFVPSGLGPGDTFRLLYATKERTKRRTGQRVTAVVSDGITTAEELEIQYYDDFVRADLHDLGGAAGLRRYGGHFKAVASTGTRAGDAAAITTRNGGAASAHAGFAGGGGAPVYWVKGAKAADDNADFRDGSWDNEANPTHADGTAHTVHSAGYWTGSDSTGGAGRRCTIPNHDPYLLMGADKTRLGYLNVSGDNTKTPLGPTEAADGSTDGTPPCLGEAGRVPLVNGVPDETAVLPERPMFALSGVFTVEAGVSVAPAGAAEGSPVAFTVKMAGTETADIAVPYTLSDGRGAAGDQPYNIATSADYTNTAGSVTIAAGSTTGTISVPTTQDDTYESDHYFTVTLGTPTGGSDPPAVSTTDGSATGTITDDADLPTLKFGTAAYSAAEADGRATVTITKEGDTLVPASVRWETADGTATAPADYRSAADTGIFGAERTARDISIDIVTDSASESNENFKVRFVADSVAHARLVAPTEATVTIIETVPVSVSMTATPGDVAEGGTKDITVSLSRALTGSETVTARLVVHGAVLSTDYTLAIDSGNSDSGVNFGASDHPIPSRYRVLLNFIAGDRTAVLRFTALQNTDRDEPTVYIGFRQNNPVMASNLSDGIAAGRPAGEPLIFNISDDETGPVPVPPNWPLKPPGLSAGESFRLAFVTSEHTAATSTDIEDYNRFVQSVAARKGHTSFIPYAGLVRALASTAAVDARDNTDTNTSSDGAGEEIYWLNPTLSGSQKIADDYADLYDGTWDNPDNVSPQTEVGWPTAAGDYFTGSGDDGTAHPSNPLGHATGVRMGSLQAGANRKPLDSGFNVAPGTAHRIYALSPVFTVTDPNAPPTVTLASATGDVTEGGAGAAGYKDITVTLGRALRGNEIVLVPLVLEGAAREQDYTIALHPETQTGVTLAPGALATDPEEYGINFSAGGSRATLRFTPVDNGDRSQPAVRVTFGTGGIAPQMLVGTAGLGALSGSPLVFSIIDDETGDLVVPQNWPLKPEAVSGGEKFRLLFVTSQTRDGRPTDIGVYNDFVQGVAASTGQSSLKPYAGLVKVVGCTSAVPARENTGMWASNAYADGSTTDSSAGIPVYWLDNTKVADNYFDFYDGSWDGTRADDDRREDGTAAGSYNAYTGCQNNGVASTGRHLGNSGGFFYARHSDTSPLNHNNNSRGPNTSDPFYAISPVLTVSTEAPPTPGIEFDTDSFTVFENGAISYRYRLKTDPGANPVTVTVANTAGDVRTWSTPPRAQTFRTSSAPEAQRWNTWRTVTLHAIDDTDADMSHETVSLVHTITQSSGAYSGLGTVALPGTILDDDATPADLITVTTVSTLVKERDVKRYSVNLKQAPGAGKVVTLTATLPKDDREALALQHPRFGPQHTVTRTFTNSNWNRPQWIRLYALNDNDKHSEQDLRVRHWTSIAKADGTADTASLFHQAIVQPARVFITDDDAGRNEGFTVEIGDIAANNPVIDKDEHADIEINFSDALGADETLGLVVEVSGAEHGADYAIGVHGSAGSGRIETPTIVDAYGTAVTSITVIGNDEAAQMDQVRGVLLRIAAKTEEHRVITVKLIGAYSSDDTVAARDMVEGVRVRECASDDPDCASKTITILPTDRVVVQDGTTELRSFPIEATLTEGSSKTYNVKLSTSPGTGGGATVSFTSSDTGAATVSPATMTFTSGTYAINQVLTV
ncbi:MAG: hypothetical protein OXG55_10310, partial [bacterium]|nr:hypothetical protein [bacterium]